MIFLQTCDFSELKHKYDVTIKYFPIITSVIEQSQKGYVLKEDDGFLIVHKFGFAYLLGEPMDKLTYVQNAKNKLTSFIPKLRIYDPLFKLNTIKELIPHKSLRKKYILEDSIQNEIITQNIVSVKDFLFDYTSLFELELCSRFWTDCSDFKNNSFGVIDKAKTGICYAAAVADGFNEIDVYVTQSGRGIGMGTKLVKKFCENSFDNHITPLWDCYANNLPSIRLAEKNNFKKIFDYDYYNIV